MNEDGTWTMSKELVKRWKRQMMTSYESLTEKEKDSDRKEEDKIIKALSRVRDLL